MAKDLATTMHVQLREFFFINFKNVADSTRVRLPFGIAQLGKVLE